MVRKAGGKPIAVKLKGLLEAKGWKPSELVHRSGLKPASVYEWLRGGKEPRPSNLTGLANALEVSSDYLLGLDPIYEGLTEVQVAARESLKRCLRGLGIGADEPITQLCQEISASGTAPRTVEKWEALITGILPIVLAHEKAKLDVDKTGRRRRVIPLSAKAVFSAQKSSRGRRQ